MSTPLLSLRNASLTINKNPLFTDITLHVRSRERHCLIGRNGAGKTTLFKLLSGKLEADVGERFVQPGTRIGMLAQEPRWEGNPTVAEYVTAPLELEDQYKADSAMQEAGLDPEQRMNNLSGGGVKRAALAQMLAWEPEVLLLDEPTNHLDINAIEWLEEQIRRYPGAVVIISHDRRFLSNITNRMLWLDRGGLRTLDQGFAHFERWQEDIATADAKEMQRLGKKLEDEEHWLRYGVSARRTRNERRLGMLHELRAKIQQEQAHVSKASASVQTGQLAVNKSAERALEIKQLRKAYGEKIIARDFSASVVRGDRIGLVGANGVGKTSVIKMLLGAETPDAGSVTMGARLEVSWFDQRRESLDGTKNLWETLCPGGGDHVEVGGQMRHVISYLKDFLFSAEQAKSPISSLSGGEASRLLLAKILANPGNLLVLDEPTNDLDMDTLEVLLDVLGEYKGTLLVVSHDRDFLDRLVNKSWLFESDGVITELVGGYQECKAWLSRKQSTNKVAAKVSVERPLPVAEVRAVVATKLSYKLERELALLPEQITALQAEIEQLTTQLASADFYQHDPKGFAATTARVGEAQTALTHAEERWLELEMMKTTAAS